MDSTSDKYNNDVDPLKLKIDAHVIQQLGAELISGPDIALVELIKNSHDADASFCYIEIDTEYTETIEHEELINGKLQTTYKSYNGKISVKDNGHGMNRERINRSWLTVSYSEKKEAKANGYITNKYSRTYVGDKGLGRLGSMQLGSICRISTYNKADAPGISVSFSWDDFTHGKTLESIMIEEHPLLPQKNSGTTIEIIGLKDIDFWKKNDANIIRRQLASMVSPHGQISNFKTFYINNGISEDLESLSEELLDQASSIFDFSITKNQIITSGKIEILPFKPNTLDRKTKFDSFIQADHGYSLYKYLKQQINMGEFNLEYSKDKYFLTFSHSIDMDDLSFVSNDFHPGNFTGKIFNFLLSKDALDIEDTSFVKIKESIKEISGDISIYRDGFKVGSGDKDWLGLSKDMTSGIGAYSLRPTNVTGYINLTWQENRTLKEKSDRESFVNNPQYQAFYELCRHSINTINTFLNLSRRHSLKFIDNMIESEGGKPKGYSAKQATQELDNIVKKSVKIQPRVTKTVKQVKESFIEKHKQIDDAIARNQHDMFNDPVLEKELFSIKELVNSLQQDVNSQLDDYQSFTNDLASHIHSTKKVINEIQSYENQIKNFYDHVAIGLSAQTLAHEANEQVRNIRLHLNSARKQIETLGIKDINLTKELNSIRGDSQVLSKAISSLNPLVKAQREIIENINISEFINDYFELRNGYFSGKNISIKIEDLKNSRLISFNRGKLYQIIDNIVRNSEHWLTIFKLHNPDEDLILTISTNKNIITIWDNAKGIRPPLEDILFDMFATDKEFGQGLGLYIVKTLLKERKCSIKLLEERNKFNRRFKFEINLVEALV